MKYQTYLKKDRQRKAAQRLAARVALTTAEVEEHHLKEKQRIRDHQAKKYWQAYQGEASQQQMSTPYHTTQAIGKAMKRAQTSLPLSPRKIRYVVESLAKKVGLSIDSSPSSSTCNYGAVSEDT